MFAAATSLFTRTNVSQNYVIYTPGQAPSPPIPSGSGAGSVLPVAPPAPPFKIGLWRVQSASHKVTGKRVSVWSFDKRGPDVDKLGPQSKERVIEVLKSEVSENTLISQLTLKVFPTGFRA
jgi:SCY1-like protein 2